MLNETLNIVTPVFLVVGAGYLAASTVLLSTVLSVFSVSAWLIYF